MQLDTIINKLCCPFDKSGLTLKAITRDEQNNILEGVLTCKECKRIYPVISGIPIMTPDEFREPSLEQAMLEKWEKFLDGGKVENFRLIEE